jgi:hypothetical protein
MKARLEGVFYVVRAEAISRQLPVGIESITKIVLNLMNQNGH